MNLPNTGFRIGIAWCWNRNLNRNQNLWNTLESESESESLAIGIGIGIMDFGKPWNRNQNQPLWNRNWNNWPWNHLQHSQHLHACNFTLYCWKWAQLLEAWALRLSPHTDLEPRCLSLLYWVWDRYICPLYREKNWYSLNFS